MKLKRASRLMGTINEPVDNLVTEDLTRVFIGGTGRSGTSIMKKVLSLHPDVEAVAREFWIITGPGGLMDLVDDLSVKWSRARGNAAIWSFRNICHYATSSSTPLTHKVINKLFMGLSPYFQDSAHIFPAHIQHPTLKLDIEGGFGPRFLSMCEEFIDQVTIEKHEGIHGHAPMSRWFYETHPYSYEEISQLAGEFIDDLYGLKGAKRVWVEDDPKNVLHMDRLQAMFPTGNVKFIHMLRHPFDVVASLISHGGRWAPNSFESCLTLLSSTIDGIGHALERFGQATETVLHQRFEDFIGDPLQALRKICDFIGIVFDESLLSLPLDAHHMGRGMTELSDKQRRMVWDQVGGFYERFGYSRQGIR